MSETLVKVDGVSKKFCRSLKKSLWYGMQDLGREITGQRHGGDGDLRSEEFWAVKDVSFELKRGECLGLIGHNGAGKTTLLKIMNGLVKPDGGRLEMSGKVGALIALGAGFNPILTGRENIFVNAAILGLTKKETDSRFKQIIDFADIGDFLDAPVQTYSSGMAVRLGFAIAANTEPDILLLDEVLAVGDIAFQAKCFNTIADFRQRGVASILVSHNMHQIARYADQVLYLRKGRSAFCGDREHGIEKFLADMNQSSPETENETTDWEQVYGSGRMMLTGARFRNADGEIVNAIDVGDCVTLEIDYESREHLVQPPTLDILIRDHEGVVFQSTNVAVNQPFQSFSTQGCFQITFTQFSVNANYVEFYLTLMEAKTLEVLDWKRKIRLNIRPIATSIGRISMTTIWAALDRTV